MGETLPKVIETCLNFMIDKLGHGAFQTSGEGGEENPFSNKIVRGSVSHKWEGTMLWWRKEETFGTLSTAFPEACHCDPGPSGHRVMDPQAKDEIVLYLTSPWFPLTCACCCAFLGLDSRSGMGILLPERAGVSESHGGANWSTPEHLSWNFK